MFGVSHAFSYFVLLKSVGAGYLVGALYCLFRLLRSVGLNQKATVFILDVFFFVLSAFLIFLLLLEINAGILRFYIFTAVLFGFILFLFVPGAVMVRLSAPRARHISGKRKSVKGRTEENKE